MLLHPAISWYDVCFYFAGIFLQDKSFWARQSKVCIKGINYCELALFPNIKDCEFNTNKFIIKGFKLRLLKHT